MTKEEYLIQKEEIIKAHGKPEYDNYAPVNEAARLLEGLKLQRRNAQHAINIKAAKEAGKKMAPDGMKEIADTIDPKDRKEHELHTIPQIFLDETDLRHLTDDEKRIVELHYFNLRLTDKQIALELGLSRQKVTAFLKSTIKLMLDAKVFDKLMPIEERIALLRAVRAGDSKIVLRMSEHHKVIEPEKKDINLTNTPIEDPKAIQLLKELGDSLAQDSNDPPLGPIPK
jgi:hypothetical protein